MVLLEFALKGLVSHGDVLVLDAEGGGFFLSLPLLSGLDSRGVDHHGHTGLAMTESGLRAVDPVWVGVVEFHAEHLRLLKHLWISLNFSDKLER
jgi:hypothetical protein